MQAANEDEDAVVVAVKTVQEKVAERVMQAYESGSVIDVTKSKQITEVGGITTSEEDKLREGAGEKMKPKPDEDAETKAVEEMIKNDIEYAAECAALNERLMNPKQGDNCQTCQSCDSTLGPLFACSSTSCSYVTHQKCLLDNFGMDTDYSPFYCPSCGGYDKISNEDSDDDSDYKMKGST